ncbi:MULTISPECIES: toprim domain-containing protein [Maribacter]|jgi:hypothetical protein|uniref:Toprim domain-containing protein n=2 Tax=Maribacter cobaltidurans TaxID=1178778 RepID=A0ABU7ISY1_9FLAO|nr:MULTISPECIES: toprim domain-containing protein [Maribacter]ASV32354.1 hypothetical protein CJ263_20155 [Maribacter cobaltidurans]MDC6388701.1 toprim domain-containing protein [Maribacter sp. PR1]MEE1976090.1 toprim domain-containing protein [Maribacter cobaltidurans]GGD94454.1 hypothetical protein GCM10011412_35560 [Maribacter cobaltidurans]
MKSPNYRDDPEHYKRSIAKINEEVNFPMYLHQNGYQLITKSAGSMEFQNDEDRIVLQTKRNPVTYFNRNDSFDKGLFFKYLMQRSENFYKAVQAGLEIAARAYGLEHNALRANKPNTFVKSLEENYNIVPLRNSQYLRVQRSISRKTLNTEAFKGRIFNAYHIRDNGGKIANIAFPKYDLEGNAKNYILYNRPYRSKKDNEIKKFRLVLNQKDHFLFHSKPIDRPARILFGESGIDLLSYHELYGKPDNFYVSFGGNVYQEKLQFFVQLIEPILQTKKTELISITDNDLKGHEFDLKIFTAVINRYNPNIYIETAFRSGKVSMGIHYTEKVRGQLSHHTTILNKKLTSDIEKDYLVFDLVRCVGFSDKILLEFSLNEVVNTPHIEQKQNVFKTLLNMVNALYLPFQTDLHKSQGKDWNDDLCASKSITYLKMDAVVPNVIAVGDKIELHTTKGPEGGTNQGLVKSIKKNSVVCDFGLNYTYAIPYSAIHSHFKKSAAQVIEQGSEKSKMNSKNNTLQNNLS